VNRFQNYLYKRICETFVKVIYCSVTVTYSMLVHLFCLSEHLNALVCFSFSIIELCSTMWKGLIYYRVYALW